MQHGDLATWDVQSTTVILEGVLARPGYEEHGFLRKTKDLLPPTLWAWSTLSLKTMVRYSYNSVPIDIVTFISQEVADEAAEWMLARDVPYSSCEFSPYEVFTESLLWRPNVSRVIDSDPDRLVRYGAKAYEAQWGGEF